MKFAVLVNWKKNNNNKYIKMNKYKQAINEFEDIINKAKINAYSKQSLKKPLSKNGLKDFKEAIKGHYGLSDEDLNMVLKGGKK